MLDIRDQRLEIKSYGLEVEGRSLGQTLRLVGEVRSYD